MTTLQRGSTAEPDETSYWSEDANGRPIKVILIGGWKEPYEAEFAAWDRLPWWRKLLAQFGWWV